MPLTCSCDEWDGEGWYYINPTDFINLKTKYRRRCCSCNIKINLESLCLIFTRHRGVEDNEEYNILGEDAIIDISSWYMCEKCGEIFLNLNAIGYCIDIQNNMFDLLDEYQDVSGFKR
jgi:hypothetical protein